LARTDLAPVTTARLIILSLVSKTRRYMTQEPFHVEGISLFGAQVVALFFWVALAGLPVAQAFVITSVVLAVCLWGVGLLRVFSRDLIRQPEFGLWFFGPGLILGALVLFVLRLVLPRDAFLVIGLGIPAVLTAIILWRRAKQRYANSRDVSGLCSIPNMSQCFLLFIGLSAFAFEWPWVVPVGVLAILGFGLARFSIEYYRWLALALIPIILLAGVLSRTSLPEWWWMGAEGIPYDETILETVSNQLIQYGPTVNVLHQNLGGMAGAAYHHLTYVVAGLVNFVANPTEYRTLLLVMPGVFAIGITSSVLLLYRNFSCTLRPDVGLYPFSLSGLIAALVFVRSSGAGSPSAHFGFAAVVAFVALLTGILRHTESRFVSPGLGDLLLISLAVAAVAFSKVPFTYAPIGLVCVFAMFDPRRYWRLALAAVLSGGVAFLWFRFFATADNGFVIGFWPYKNFASTFSFSSYTILVAYNTLIVPMLPGLVASALVALLATGFVRRLAIGFLTVSVVSALSQLFISHSVTRDHLIFLMPYAPIGAAAFVTLTAANPRLHRPKLVWLIGSVSVAWLLVRCAPLLNSVTANVATLTAVLVVLSITVSEISLWRTSRTSDDKNHKRGTSVARASALLISSVVVVWATQTFPNAPRLTREYPTREISDWYGTPDLQDVARFIEQETSTKSLIAYSLCDPARQVGCGVDLRPAVLTQRQFLALDPLFTQDMVDELTWTDVSLSRSVGHGLPHDVIAAMAARGVEYLLVDRSRVGDTWIQGAERSGVTTLYTNANYSLLGLDN
jgi:hypothetical protein